MGYSEISTELSKAQHLCELSVDLSSGLSKEEIVQVEQAIGKARHLLHYVEQWVDLEYIAKEHNL